MKMNSKQKKVIVFAVAVMVLMTLFPPWTQTFHRTGGATLRKPAGYSFIFDAPEPSVYAAGIQLDFSRLLLQWFVVALIAGGLVFAFKDQ